MQRSELWKSGINDEYCWEHHPGGWQCLPCRLEVTLGGFFAAFEQYIKSLITDRWIWGEYSDGEPCILHGSVSENASQEWKDEFVAYVFANYNGVVSCHEWVQMERYTTIDGIELEGPVNVLVQSWDNK
jgi:hypothetical protein